MPARRPSPPLLTRIQNGGEPRVHIPCNRISTPSSRYIRNSAHRNNYFFAKSGDLDQAILDFPPSNDRRFVEGAMRKKYIYIFLSRLGAELRGGDPFAMQVTPHPPSRYLPAWASCTCGRTPRNAERVGVCTPRDRCGCGGRCTCRHRQNLSAMHDRSVAYKPRRAARHYAGRKQKDDSLAAGQSPFAC